MRFLVMMMATRETEAGLPMLGRTSEMDRFQALLAQEGMLLAADKLMPSSAGLRVEYKRTGGDCVVTGGPFADGRMPAEVLALEAGSIEEVLERIVQLRHFAGSGGLELEIRPICEPAGRRMDPSASAMEAELRDQMSMLSGH